MYCDYKINNVIRAENRTKFNVSYSVGEYQDVENLEGGTTNQYVRTENKGTENMDWFGDLSDETITKRLNAYLAIYAEENGYDIIPEQIND